ncbi:MULTISPECIES: pentapeptide repeat-containing protein [Trichocoleus]|nr:pentapeptide repeat-containing protein [Trichocoleus sp. FACHB-46]
MKAWIFVTVVLSTPVWSGTLLTRAENSDHLRQLLSTKQCQKCDLSGAGLVLADLSNADLREADLSGVNLSRANLTNANLSGAKLLGASLFGANLGGANLRGADLGSADLRTAYLWNADLQNANLINTLLKGSIGLAASAVTAEEVYKWALEEAQVSNHGVAVDYYNQALILKPDFAPGYLGRAISRYRLGDGSGGIQDAQYAERLFTHQGNLQGSQTSQALIKEIQTPPKSAKQGGGGGGLLSILGSVLQLFLF